MLNSIISRGQGLGNSGAKTGQIELGIFQSAIRRAIDSPIHSSSDEEKWSSYLSESLQNSVGSLVNATTDALAPLDRLSIGNALLYQYQTNATGTSLDAVVALKTSTDLQTRNNQGGFWYYAAYPQWSYNDGLYSLPAWYVHYADLYEWNNLTAVVQDVVHQFELLWSHTYDPVHGLVVHGYDASKTAVWANPVTGASSIIWGRAMGWYLTGLLDTLEVLPDRFPVARAYLEERYNQLVDAIVAAVDSNSGVWWQVVNQGGRSGNYLESSASALYTYNILRGARLGHLGKNCTSRIAVGKRAWEYMRDNFVVPNPNGTISWDKTVAVCSLNSSATYGVRQLMS